MKALGWDIALAFWLAMLVLCAKAAFGATIAGAGEWVTTPEGKRVCQLSYTLEHGSVMSPDFCMNWQPPFNRVERGQLIPFGQGWVRKVQPSGWESRWGTMQIHIEGKGWVP